MWSAVWLLSLLAAGLSLVRCVLLLKDAQQKRSQSQTRVQKQSDASLLQVWIETLESGHLPQEEHWGLLNSLSPPLRRLVPGLLQKLRENGAPLLPTLRRLRQFSEDQAQSLREARVQVGQIRAQLLVSIVLNFVFAFATWFLVPEVQDSRGLFFVAIFICIFFSGVASWLIHRMIDRALWQAVPKELRPIISEALLSGERLLGKIETGLPPDVAWLELLLELDKTCPELALAWRQRALWVGSRRSRSPRSLRPIFSFGYELREGIDACILDGRAARDRIERQFLGLRATWWSAVQQNLKRLPTQALSALFLGVLPGSIALFVVAGIAILSSTEMAL
jgi:hypothetical protein